MPTYLTPGVYVEEVTSGKKPIEGVGTAVAAFVGLAPGGPVNVPMRISNWSQFARIYGDTTNPDNGPFMEGAYLAHSVYGYFQNGGSLCWVVRVGAEENGKTSARAALPAASDQSVEALRAVALDAGAVTVDVEISEEETPPEGDPTYKVVVTSGAAREEFAGVTLRKGRTYIATKVNAESKLIKIEDTGASLPDVRLAPGKYALQVPSVPPAEVKPADFEGDVAKRQGMGGLAAIDEITMIAMPDMMQFATAGDGARVRDLQGKLIAHCENAGERMAILDCPSGPEPAGGLRVADERSGLRLQDGRALLPVDRGDGPADAPADDDPAVGPHRRGVGPRRPAARSAQGARQRGHHGRQRTWPSRSPTPSREASTRTG